MEKIRIDFCDFGSHISKTNNYLFKLLTERFDVELCDQPDFLIYGSSGHEHRLHSGVRIFFSGESDLPDFRECDYSIASVKLEDPRHLQFPLYILYGEPEEIIKQNDAPAKIMAAKIKFCSFIVSGYHPRKNHNRVAFFQKLSRYKRVDSGGRQFNNIGGPIPGGPRGKIEFLRQYKFNIAYENRSLPGYTTEKIFEPMVARCLPICWGNPLIAHEFNSKSFLNRTILRATRRSPRKSSSWTTTTPSISNTCANRTFTTINQIFILAGSASWIFLKKFLRRKSRRLPRLDARHFPLAGCSAAGNR